MTFLDYDRLDALDEKAFQRTKPYAWMNPGGLLTEEGYRRLVETLPDVSIFQPSFGVERSHGQHPHDRYILEYDESLPVSDEWHAFARELHEERYRNFVRRMFGRGLLRLSYHWHYTPNGCSISPHCDAKRKLGSHIFYFNREEEWKPEWGGQTLVLDDHGRFPRDSAPKIEDFDSVSAADAVGNYSFLFARGDKSWHGMREIHCPEGTFRKVFIVVVEDWARGLKRTIKLRLRGEKAASY